MGLNRNLNLLKEASMADNCIKLQLIVGFQNNKTTETRFRALQYHHSFTNYVKCVQKQNYADIRTELKGNLLCLHAQPETFGNLMRRMLPGVIKTAQWDTLHQSLYIL